MRVSSPQKREVVFILCDGNIPVGSCFAVKDKYSSNSHVLTARHNLNPSLTKGDEMFLATQFSRFETGLLSSAPIPLIEVHVDDWDDALDWAVLTRTDGAKFRDIECIEVQISACQPGDKVKTYHYPVSYFTQTGISVCTILQVANPSWSKVSNVFGSTMQAETGLVKGSSGGVMVDDTGKAVAIYLSALSPVEICEYAKVIAFSSVENPFTMKEGRVIACTPRLRDYFM